ncbi:MAG TPA: alpha/beta fold hydrolase [Kofleriaceae bacterium]|nr:alpha/beta fold hydrolase [Kofleriaceae bacterium]
MKPFDVMLETSAGRFAGLVRGPRNGPPVLLLHGFPDHAPSWLPLMDRLAERGFRAVAPWLRGYAPSVLDGPHDVSRLTADVLALADAVAPGRKLSLVGHDWGAIAAYPTLLAAPDRFACAVTMAVPHPVALLANGPRNPMQLARSWYVGLFQLGALGERAATARDFALIDRLWRRWSPDFTLPAPARAALHACLAASMPAPIRYYRSLNATMADARARHRRGERIATPLFNLHGARDGCVGPALARDQERFFTGPFAAEIVDGAGHFLQLEAPDRVAERMIPWLARWRA